MRKLRPRDLVTSAAAPLGLTVLAAGILTLVAVSPLLLKLVAKIHGVNWASLSNVGQTYGGVSALLSALALGGVVISLLYQARDVGNARDQAARTFHFDLLKMEMNDPLYMEMMAAPYRLNQEMTDYDALRGNNFIHMWVTYWEARYMLREIPEANLRYVASNELFTSTAGRRYWSTNRDVKLNYSRGRLFRFVKILDEEYAKAVANGPPVTVHLRKEPDNVRRSVLGNISRTESITFFCAGVGAAAVVGRLLRRRFFQEN